MAKRLIPIAIALGLVGLLVYQLVGEGSVECRVCVNFEGRRHCAKAVGPTEADARREAQSTACSRLASGVTESFACPNVPPEEVSCQRK